MYEKEISEISGNINLFDNMYPQEMATFTQRYFNIVYQSVITGVADKTFNQLREYTNTIENIISDLGIDEDKDRQKVYYIAIMKALTEFIRKNAEEIEETNTYISYCSKFSYLTKILSLLSTEKAVTHSEMAMYLGVKNNTLTNYIKRIKDLGFFRTYSSGKNKMYFINTKGIDFYNSVEYERSKQNLEPVYNSLLSELFKILLEEIQSGNPDANRIISGVHKANVRNIPYFCTYDMKQNIFKLVSSIKKSPKSESQLENYNIVRSSYYKDTIVYGSSNIFRTYFFKNYNNDNKKLRPTSLTMDISADNEHNEIFCNYINPNNNPIILRDSWGYNTDTNRMSIRSRDFVHAIDKRKQLLYEGRRRNLCFGLYVNDGKDSKSECLINCFLSNSSRNTISSKKMKG